MSQLRTAIVIDYQNVHLTAHGLFDRYRPPHESLIHPGQYAKNLIQRRNSIIRDRSEAVLTEVDVYRGLPNAKHDPDFYGRNLAHKSQWERDPSIHVTHRPLKYTYKYADDGTRATDGQGNFLIAKREEKGVDVLCALGLVRRSLEDDIDLVILCTQDTDLSHAIDEELHYGQARVETTSWFAKGEYRRSKEIRPSLKGIRIWNTRMGQREFFGSIDRTQYF